MKKWIAVIVSILTVLSICGCLANADSVVVGSIITMGQYEQDNNPDNGPEPIDWIVLDVQDGKALLISRYGLDAKPYDGNTWETCALRSWLNDELRKTAFSETEQSSILLTEVSNSNTEGYSEYNASGGNDTQDYIFLLSYREAFELYYFSSHARRCVPTDYAIANGAWTSDNDQARVGIRHTGAWWLRSPGQISGKIANVHALGSIYVPYPSRQKDLMVRPAFWLDLRSRNN